MSLWEGSDGDNMLSKVLNGMKSAFNANTAKRPPSAKRTLSKEVTQPTPEYTIVAIEQPQPQSVIFQMAPPVLQMAFEIAGAPMNPIQSFPNTIVSNVIISPPLSIPVPVIPPEPVPVVLVEETAVCELPEAVADEARIVKVHTVEEADENQPRIVLKFKSDKGGSRSTNVKIVTDDVKISRRSPRGKSSTSVESDSKKESKKSSNRHHRKEAKASRESDEFAALSSKKKQEFKASRESDDFSSSKRKQELKASRESDEFAALSSKKKQELQSSRESDEFAAVTLKKKQELQSSRESDELATLSSKKKQEFKASRESDDFGALLSKRKQELKSSIESDDFLSSKKKQELQSSRESDDFLSSKRKQELKSSIESDDFPALSSKKKQEFKSGRESDDIVSLSSKKKQELRCSIESDEFVAQSSKKKQEAKRSKSKESEGHAAKRSARRRSKDYCDNVLANAIARKEKIYEATNGGVHTRPSRRIKPTAKVLANRELQINLETQNSARAEKVLGDDVKLTRSRLKRSHDKNIAEKTKPKKGSEEKKSTSDEEKKRDSSKNFSPYSTIKDVDRPPPPLDTSYDSPNTKSVKAIKNTKNKQNRDEDVEHKRINKLKRKHLEKLGLQAVTGVSSKYSKDRENLTDESTMDSTKTEAIIEHLNSRNRLLNTSSTPATTPVDDIDTNHDTTNKETKNVGKSRRLRCVKSTKRRMSVSDSDEEHSEHFKTNFDNHDEASIRVTRKRSKVEVTLAADQSNFNDEQSLECDDSTFKSSCFCDVPSNLHADPNSLKDNKFCKAIELIGNRNIGCGRLIANDIFIRASSRTPFFLACEMHHYRLSLHHCCAGCGIFCTQGIFYQCTKGHLFHWECSLPFVPMLIQSNQVEQCSNDAQQPSQPKGTLTDLYNTIPGCPHCGLDNNSSNPINTDCIKINLDVKCSTPMIFLPSPRLQWMPACMSFSSINKKKFNVDDNIEQSVLPKHLLTSITNNLNRLSIKQGNSIDYDDLLIKTNSEIQKDMALIKAVCEKENTIENIIDALNSGSDPKKHIPHIDNGTFLHLAARELNLGALHIFKILGCDLDALDIENRTPLMLAVMNFDTDLSDRFDEAKDEDSDNFQLPANCEQSEFPGNIDNRSDIGDTTEGNHSSINDKDLVGYQKEYRIVIDYLLKAGSDVTLKGPNGATVLHLAAKFGDVVTCSTILNNYSHITKSFINQKDDGEWTPLVWAVENKRNSIVRFLLENGADPMLRDSENNVALHWAATTGCSDIMEDLLNYGAQINIANSAGNTPLHLCAKQNHYSCLIILLARGAQINLKNLDGETPIECLSDSNSDCYSALLINEHLQKIVGPGKTLEKILSQDISNGKEATPVRCTNSVDEENLEGKFIYVTKNCYTTDINIDRKITSIQSCQCKDRCDSYDNGCNCANLSMQCWYNSEGKLTDSFDYKDPPIIFECNDFCGCNKLKCVNCVVGKGSRISLKVVRLAESSADGAGWGVCSAQFISKGTFVTEYVGELLPGALAYHREDDSYLFELQIKDDLLEDAIEPYCIDAKKYGNISRFINHKCEPNVVPVRVFVDHHDLRFPRIAFFSLRDINAGEEIGFDYGPKFWNINIKKFLCNCNSDVCCYNNLSETKSEGDISEIEHSE